MKSALLVATAITLGGFVAACDVQVSDKGVSLDLAQGKATEEWTRTYTLPAGGRLDVVNVNGPIRVEPSAGTTVEVRATRTAKAGSDAAARQLLAQSAITEEVAADHVRVEVPHAPGGTSGFRRSSVSVEYDVRVPAGLTVSVKTENGAISLENVRGTLTAATTNGGITGRDLTGPVSAATINGGVQLALARVTGPVDAHAVNGGIRIELPPDTNAEVEATTVNGRVSLDDALKLTGGEQESRRVAGTLNHGGPKISAQTTNGGVRVYSSGQDPSTVHGR